MPSRPPFYSQETPFSCVPACLRMVLEGLGHPVTEAQIRTLCDCTIFGTEALKAVDAMRQLGFAGTTKQTGTLDDLRTALQQGQWPIVFVNTVPISGERNAHAMVVVEVGEAELTVYDPVEGERRLPLIPFLTAWAIMHHLLLLVHP